MSDKTKTPGSDLFDQAVKNYEEALKTGVRLQEECGKWWTNVLSQTTRPQDWQKNVTSVLNEAFPPAQKKKKKRRRSGGWNKTPAAASICSSRPLRPRRVPPSRMARPGCRSCGR